jgi:predicted PurR-regulated permease PerM
MEHRTDRRSATEADPSSTLPATGKRGGVRLATLIAIVLLVAVLHFAQAILLPFAIAVLLSFVLAPVAGQLEKLRIGRVGAVAVTVLLGLGIALSAAYVLGRQAAEPGVETPAEAGYASAESVQQAAEEAEQAADEAADAANEAVQAVEQAERLLLQARVDRP